MDVVAGLKMFRKLIFWSHLALGLTAGVLILVMSVTGVLLTYEPQIEDWAVARAIAAPEGAAPLSPDQLIEKVSAVNTMAGQSLVFDRDSTAPVLLSAGRNSVALDPFTSQPLVGAGEGVKAFFEKVTAIHRWLSPSGPTSAGGAIVDASNLLFLFLVVSGIYLWLPPIFRWTRLKMQLFLRSGLPSPQARHYNWHHVFGAWALVPLFLIVLSGVVMSYPWANRMVFAMVGEEAPAGRGRPGGQVQPLPAEFQGILIEGGPVSYATLLANAATVAPNWNSASISLPATNDRYLQVTMDEGNGAQSAQRTRMVLDRATGEIVSQETGASGSLGSRLRGWFRFVHTGQAYGIVGQTIAGFASLAAMILVYTGMSLGLRRLLRMWSRRKRLTP